MKDGEVKNKLSPAQVSVMQHRVTEPPYFGKYWDHFEPGRYRCAACDTPLFSSDDKFNSRTGWPSFKKPLNERDMQFKSEPGPDDKVEIRCKKCKSHLGYVIAGDEPYYRINSVCLHFEPQPTTVSAATDSKIPVIPSTTPDSTASLEPIPAATSHTISSLIAGMIVGTLIGGGAMAYYLNTQSTPPQETATSSSEVATTTVELPGDMQPIEPTPETPVDQAPPVSDIQAEVQDTTGTSTQ